MAYSLFYLGSELILTDIRNPVGQVPISYDIAGPRPVEPLRLVPAQLSLSPAGPSKREMEKQFLLFSSNSHCLKYLRVITDADRLSASSYPLPYAVDCIKVR
jgi:hypothetical protein